MKNIIDLLHGLFYTYYWRYRRDSSTDIPMFRFLIVFGVLTTPYWGIIAFILDNIIPPWYFCIRAEFVGVAPAIVTICVAYYFLRHKRYRRILANHQKYDKKKYRYAANGYAIFFFIALFVYIVLLINIPYKWTTADNFEQEEDYSTSLTIIRVSTDDTIQVYPN